MVINQLQQQKKPIEYKSIDDNTNLFSIIGGINRDKIPSINELINILKEQLKIYSADFITIEFKDNQINIFWFDNFNALENQLKEQEILKNLDIEIYPLIWKKIRNWGLNENGL